MRQIAQLIEKYLLNHEASLTAVLVPPDGNAAVRIRGWKLNARWILLRQLAKHSVRTAMNRRHSAFSRSININGRKGRRLIFPNPRRHMPPLIFGDGCQHRLSRSRDIHTPALGAINITAIPTRGTLPFTLQANRAHHIKPPSARNPHAQRRTEIRSSRRPSCPAPHTPARPAHRRAPLSHPAPRAAQPRGW